MLDHPSASAWRAIIRRVFGQDPFFDEERFLTSTESDSIEVDEAADVTVPTATPKAV